MASNPTKAPTNLPATAHAGNSNANTPIPQESSTFEEEQQQIHAHQVLESAEQLIWYANAWNESIPQTRIYFEKILCGVNPDLPEPEYAEAKYGDKLPDYLRGHIAHESKRGGREKTPTAAQAVKEEAGVKLDTNMHMDIDEPSVGIDLEMNRGDASKRHRADDGRTTSSER